MFPDYQSLVIQHYEKKLNENQLSFRLSHPTTAQLKAECVAKSGYGFLPKDRKTLVDFFGENGDDKAILEEIANCYTDIFKPLLNYLNKKTSNTNPKNIELLAWLTDFEPRPHERGKKYILEELETGDTSPEEFEKVKQQPGKEEQIGENKKPGANVVETPPKGPTVIIIDKKDDVEKKPSSLSPHSIGVKLRTNRKAVIAILIVAISAAVGLYMYTVNGRKKPRNTIMESTLNKENGCMYWAGDHYQQVPCSQKMGDTMVVALDMERLNYLKRITREDTIKRNSKGWVWYIKLNNKVEFYTFGGNYPLDPTLKLKPVTDYIIDKYVSPAQAGTSQ